MDYEQYEAEDFLMDDSFRNYCLEINEKDTRFWKNWIAGHPAKYDTLQQAKEMYFTLNGQISPRQIQQHEKKFLAAVQQHVNAGPAPQIRSRRIWLYASMAAAAVLAFIMLPYLRSQKAAPVQNNLVHTSNAGERKSFQLPDGSKVTLNAGSTITLAPGFNNQSRELQLQGEAYFDVAHSAAKPFIIHTTTMDVKVLGTVFNVKAYPNDKVTETALLKGLVEVTVLNNEDKKIILHPNQKIILPNQHAGAVTVPAITGKKPTEQKDPYTIAGLTYSTTDSSLIEVSWTQNRLAFNENSFEEIAAQLERWYNVTIRFGNDEVKQYRFTATFDQKNITQVLDALKWSRPFKYSIDENNAIYIE